METQTKLQMEIIKEDGRVLKYVSTEASHKGLAGHFTDTYKDEDGNIHYVDRLANAITFTTHSRRTGDGNMISFSMTFEHFIQGLLSECSDIELDKLLLKCEHPLNKAKEFYKKELPETYEQRYLEALKEKVEEKIKEVTFGEPSPVMTAGLERALYMPRLQNNPALHNILKLEHYKATHPEADSERDLV